MLGAAMPARLLLPLLLFLLCPRPSRADSRHAFDGPLSEPVLRSYLSRSVTVMYLLTDQGDLTDNIRMLKDTGAKFAGRAVYNWGREQGGESALPEKLERAKANAAKVHAADPEIILQGCVFEIVTRDVNNLAIPAWVFEALELPVETRNFRFPEMGYPGGRGKDQWGPGSCVPDVSRTETRLWFHYLAGSYINIGCEALHFGQAQLMNGNDPDLRHWDGVLRRARAHAAIHARRHAVLCDAHVPGGGLVMDGRLLLDFHTFPLRVEEIPDKPREGRLRTGFSDGIYGRSRGGVTPAGWRCEHLPFLVEFDNYGRSRQPGAAGTGGHWVWGWDEITWFSQLSPPGRADWLRYAWKWVRENDPAGYVQMPGLRCLSGAADGKRFYYANRASAATPHGYGDEEAIREIWAADK